MESVCVITEEMFVAAYRLSRKMTRNYRIGFLVAAVGLIVIAVTAPKWNLQFASICALVGAPVGHGISQYITGPWSARRQYRKYKSIKDPFSVTVSDEGVKFVSTDSQGLVRWETILKWRESSKQIILFVSPRLFHIVPKGIDSPGFSLDRLVEKLRSEVGEPI